MNILENKIKSNYKYFGSISILYGIMFAFCMYRNLFGATFLIYAVSTVGVLVLFLNKTEIKIKKETKIYFMAIIFFGMSTCITANKLLQFMNWIFIIGLLVIAMLNQFFDDSTWDIPTYIINSVMLFFTTIRFSFLSAKETKKFLETKEEKDNKNVSYIITGAIVALGVLVLIIPMLMSSDMIFKRIFGKIFDIFSLQKIMPNLWTGCGIFITAFAGFALIYALFYASCHVKFGEKREIVMEKYPAAAGISFCAVIGGIYLLYAGIQVVYLFFNRVGSLPEGITYSQYARAGFWQLAAVAFINIIMVLVCAYLFEENKYLNRLLTLISGCTYIMIASAAYRMCLYIRAYNTTFLRVLVLWFLLIMALIMGGVIVSIYKKRFLLVRFIVAVIVSGYLAFSFACPDYWVAKYNTAHIQDMGADDIEYIMYGLTLDAAPVIADMDFESILSDCNEQEQQDIKGRLYTYFRNISDNNEGIYFRKANVGRIRAKHAADKYLKQHANDQIYSDVYFQSYGFRQ